MCVFIMHMHDMEITSKSEAFSPSPYHPQGRIAVIVVRSLPRPTVLCANQPQASGVWQLSAGGIMSNRREGV